MSLACSTPCSIRPAADVLERCQAGDEVAWAETVTRFSGYVSAIAMRGYGLDRASAEDVLQDVFASTYEHIDRLYTEEAIRPWVGQLTRRMCIDRLRASARLEPCEAVPDSGADDPALVNIEESMVVQAALAVLSHDQREVLERFYLDDESYETIGAALDIPPGTIASRIARGISALRRELEGATVAVLVVLGRLSSDGLIDVTTSAAAL